MSGSLKNFFNIHSLVDEKVLCLGLASDLIFTTYVVSDLG